MNSPTHFARERTLDLSSDDARWEALLRRDPEADGAFYYSVKTTGVYCRPSCASRRPLRRNVRFHDTLADAQAAGFRPCKRCHPDELPLNKRHSMVVAAACRAIEAAQTPPSLADLARLANMSPFHFHRVFKSFTGVTPKAYSEAHRARRVQGELRRAERVTDAIYDAGFSSNGRFYETVPSRLGMTPSDFRAGGQGTEMRFAVGECWLGSVLVAATPKGVCAILLGDDPEALVRDLQDRFANARIIGADRAFEGWVAKVVGLIEAPDKGLDLPLDIHGTAFQQRVWQALRDIPPGTTASYSDIARRLGQPTASRAVAGACAANPLAVAIPCHRVVRVDGGLSGYRWGIERKRALIDREGVR